NAEIICEAHQGTHSWLESAPPTVTGNCCDQRHSCGGEPRPYRAANRVCLRRNREIGFMLRKLVQLSLCLFNFDTGVTKITQAKSFLLLQATPQEAADGFWCSKRQPAPIGIGFQHFGENLVRRFPVKDAVSGKHFIKHTSKCPHIG